MSLYYSKTDEDTLLNALPSICQEHRQRELMERPTAAERTAVHELVLEFIRSRDRIIYGGYALHLLIKSKSSGKDGIYSDTCFPDVEFYTPEFKEDIRDLVNFLSEHGYSYTTAEEGVHPMTFVVRCNFMNVCDITYVPLKVYDSIQTTTINKFRVISTEHAMIDIFRVYSYPLSNYYRLTKTYKRTNRLLKYYPWTFSEHKSRPKHKGSEYHHVVDTVLKEMKNVILTCAFAHNVFCQKAGLKKHVLALPYYTVLSVDFHNHVAHLLETLPKHFGKTDVLTHKMYLPFLDILGERAEFFVNGSIVLRLIEERDNCIPFRKEDSGFLISTIQSTVYYSLVFLFQARMEGWNEASRHHETILHNMQNAKKAWFNNHPKLKIVDKGLFQEFVIDCVGHNVSAIQKAALLRTKRKKERKVIKYRYSLDDKNDNFFAMHVHLPVGEQVCTNPKTLKKHPK